MTRREREERDRNIRWMHRHGGMKRSEIAELFAVSETTVYLAINPEYRERNRKYYADNPEARERNRETARRSRAARLAADPQGERSKERERNRKYYADNPEARERNRETARRSRLEILGREGGRELLAAKLRDWKRANPEKVKASKAKYVRDNREKVNAYRREHYADNREAFGAYQREKREARGPRNYRASIPDIAERDGSWACAYCGGALYCVVAGVMFGHGWGAPCEVDHMHPVKRADTYPGDIDELDNLVLACKACNSAKGNRTPGEWLATRQNPTTAP